jgi:Big-like domain-containing protein
VERKTETTGTYAWIATTGTGITTYTDSTVVAGTTYCYRVQASNASGDSDYSNEACGSIAIGGMTWGGSPTALTVAVTAPLEGSIVSQSVTVSGTASSTAARISLLLDGSIVAMAGGTTATYAWDTTTSPNGTHTWTAKAYDAAGNSVSSTPASVMVQNAAAAADTTMPAKLTLAYSGLLQDRVGQGDMARAPDGALDGTLTVTLSAPGGRTVTGLRLDSDAPGTWDTTVGNGSWVLGVATTLDGALLNAPWTMAVNFPVADGGSFVVFASDYQASEFLSGRTLTLTATFADGSTATAVTTVP